MNTGYTAISTEIIKPQAYLTDGKTLTGYEYKKTTYQNEKGFTYVDIKLNRIVNVKGVK